MAVRARMVCRLGMVALSAIVGCTHSKGPCEDGTKNGTETDVDCGGRCSPCAVGKACVNDGDCATQNCKVDLTCGPSCGDGVRNGDETDVDCGGSCSPCANGKACATRLDCAGNTCRGDSTCDCVCSPETVYVSCGGCEDGCLCGMMNRCHAGECWWSDSTLYVAGAAVQMIGVGEVLTRDANGGFTLPGGPPAFTLAVVDPVEGGIVRGMLVDVLVPAGARLKSLSLSSLSLPGVPPAPPQGDHQTQVQVQMVSGGESPVSPDTRTWALVVPSGADPQAAADAAAQAVGPVPATFAVTARWKGPSQTSARVYVMQVTAQGATYDYWGYLTLDDGVVSQAAATLVAMTTRNVSVQFSPPAGYSLTAARQVTYIGGAWLGPDTITGQSGTFTIPAHVGKGSTAACFAYEDAVSGGRGQSCGCLDDGVLPALAAPLLLSPADGATGFDPTATPLSFANVGAEYYVVTLEAPAAAHPWYLEIYTAKTSFALPDLSGLGITLDPQTQIGWSVVAHGPDGYLTYLGALTKIVRARSSDPWGCNEASTMEFPIPSRTTLTATSPARTFTTP